MLHLKYGGNINVYEKEGCRTLSLLDDPTNAFSSFIVLSNVQFQQAFEVCMVNY